MRTTAYVLAVLLSVVTAGAGCNKKSKVTVLHVPREAVRVRMRDTHNRPIRAEFIREEADTRYYTARTADTPAQVAFEIPRGELGCSLWSQLHMVFDDEACSLLLPFGTPASTVQPDGQEYLTCRYTVQVVGW